MATLETALAAKPTLVVPGTKFGEFKPIMGSTGSILYALEVNANHPDSMNLLDEAGLRAYIRQELLPLLMKDEALKNVLKGKWFYLADKGLDENGIHTIDEKCELALMENAKVSVENGVRTWKGPHPVSLGVLSDAASADAGMRFVLDAGDAPLDVSQVVVGVPKEQSWIMHLAREEILEITTNDGKRTLCYDISKIALLERK